MKSFNFSVLLLSLSLFYSSCTQSTKKKAPDKNIEIVSDEVYYQIAKELNATESSSEIFVNLPTDDIFDKDQASLTPVAYPYLEKVVKMINAKGIGTVMVTGFSDDKGDPALAQKLSTARAKAVADWMDVKGVKNDVTIRSQGVGSRFGLSNNNADGSDNLENQAKNRRVEIVIKKARLPKQ